MLRKLLIVAVSAIAGLVAQAHAVTVTVSGMDYDVSTITGTYNDLQPTLEQQPFYGPVSLAFREEFAFAVGAQFGAPNSAEGAFLAPLLASVPSASDRFSVYIYVPAQGEGGFNAIGYDSNTTYTFLLASPATAVPVPAAALLFVPALGGLAVIRRRKAA